MDGYTSKIVQRLLIDNFQRSTVITTTSRLSTAAMADRVLVMESGQTVEFETPYKLLVKEVGDTDVTNRNSRLGSLVQYSGVRMARYILRVAKERFDEINRAIESPNNSMLRSRFK